MIGVGVIGYGYWGPNLARNVAGVAGARLVGICDLSADRRAEAGRRHPGSRVTAEARELIEDPGIGAIFVATPASSHFELARAALEAGKHVLVEKPLTVTSEQADGLVAEAARRKRVLMVDHTFVYTGAVRRIHDLVASGELGDIYYYDSVRVNLGLFQSDVNVILDLAVHDLAIIDYILPGPVQAVSAVAVRNVPNEPENLAYLTLFLEKNRLAHIHVNWLAPVKIRRTLIGGSRKMIVYDDLDPSEKVKVYDRGVTPVTRDPREYPAVVGYSYRTGDMWAPRVDLTEALQTEVAHFFRCAEGRERPLTDGESGRRVVKILEAAMASVGARGRPVDVATGRITD